MASLKILLIDDDSTFLQVMENILLEEGHKPVIASGGHSGVDVFRSYVLSGHPFDIVITDLGMPYMDGSMVSTAIKKLSPSTPVILLTGWGRDLHGSEIVSHVDRVLSKPPKLSELRQALRELDGAEPH